MLAKAAMWQAAGGRAAWPGHKQHRKRKKEAWQAAAGLGARQQRAGTAGRPAARGLAGWSSQQWTQQAAIPLFVVTCMHGPPRAACT
jgi:hypothetical protein